MSRAFITIGFFVITFFTFLFSLGSYFVLTLPSQKEIKGCFTTSMYQVELCPGSKNYVKLSQISEFAKRALIQTEDAAFFDHNGFDWSELKNSFEKNLSEGKFARGGSTITQQLAKNLYLTKDKTLIRKVKEAIITMQLENSLSKNEILERYFNVVQFGPKIFGIKQAANFYFKKHPAELSVVESSFLIFLLPSPDKYSHSFFRKELTSFARKRMRQIISGMLQTHRIDESEYSSAMASLEYFPNNPPAAPELTEGESDSDIDLQIPTLEELETEEPEN